MNKRKYAEYLASPEWERVRQRKLDSKNHICELCGARAEQAHHLTYYRVGHEGLEDLQALCEPCHKYEHRLLSDKEAWEVDRRRRELCEYRLRSQYSDRPAGRPMHMAQPIGPYSNPYRSFLRKSYR